MCVTGDKQQACREAAAVFVGTVIAAGKDGVGEVQFELEAVWKIERPQESPLTVISDEDGCGYHFAVGESYLVFASKWQAGAPLSVSTCSIVLNFWQDSELRDQLPPPEWQSERYLSLIKGERLAG